MLGFWQAVSGLVIFMMGIRFMEESIKLLAGRNFKLFIKRQASNRMKSAASGAVVSAIMQSSSAVNLITLAFVGSGILKLPQALAVILGSNIGTTVTGWIIVLVGFKMDFSYPSFPLVTLGGLVWLLASYHRKLQLWGKCILGAGFLFLGLELMKSGVGDLFINNKINLPDGIPLLIFLLAGLVFTALIQSSSATMAIVLSMLNTGNIEIISAAAMVLGAEVGTAIKLLPASLGANPVKKRVAIGSILFNLLPALLLFPCLSFIFESKWMMNSAGVPLLVLIGFQTAVNIFGLILFLPLLHKLSLILENNINQTVSHLKFLSPLLMTDVMLSMEAFRKECCTFCMDAIDFSFRCFQSDDTHVPPQLQHDHYREGNLSRRYDSIKLIHGGIREYYIGINGINEKAFISDELDRLVRAVRNGMYASKNMKDIISDIEQLANSSNNTKFEFYNGRMFNHFEICGRLLKIMMGDSANVNLMKGIYSDIGKEYESALQFLYAGNVRGVLDEAEISTLVNYNRELVSAQKSLFFAVKDIVFTEAESDGLEPLPGFIR